MDGLTVGDRNSMRRVDFASGLYRESARTTRTLLADQQLDRKILQVRIGSELLRLQTIVERIEREAKELRDPALVRGTRKVIRILREQNRQYELAERARLAGDPETVSAATERAAALAAEGEQTLRRLVNRFPGLPG
ncbi:MAG: hypothetical protein H0V81_18015 [Solirubrobacterales bacterium]|nr:hypothetical protein [Solirubrobacterales bacterium]